MTNDLRFSRAQATAAALGAEDVHRFTDKSVLLTGAEGVLATANGREMSIAAVLLLMRTTTSLTVSLPPSQAGLAAELTAWATDHMWDVLPTFVDLPVDMTDFDAILSIGGVPRHGLPMTVIACDGWTVRVSSGLTPVAQDSFDANPIAALGAASLGVGEVFKRLLRLHPDAGELVDGCVFSLWSYRMGEEGSAPSLPEVLDLDVLIAGAGAIGNGVGHLISRLSVKGRVAVVDAQPYGEENWGTCLRLKRAAATAMKAKYLADLLDGPVRARGYPGRIDAVAERPDWRTPPVVLNGFDNVEARYAAQDLWPDIVIDGAIGPKLECQVTVHPWDTGTACVRCTFDLPVGPSAEAVQAQASGLAREALGDLTRVLTEADIAAAAPEKQPWLRERLGKPICSVLEEAAALSADALSKSFRPSVPFVATFSACMMVTELVRHLVGGSAVLEPKFFFSLLWGFGRGDFYPEDRHADCICVRRAKNIAWVRAQRRA
ncbi:MAG: ThiF family adenylyltransferase [Caulobacteraceae bacterium]